jgi:hypothetical protein
MIADQLCADSLLQLSLACHQAKDVYAKPLASCATLCGAEQILRFIQGCSSQVDVSQRAPCCSSGHPLPRKPTGDVRAAKSRAEAIRDLVLYEPGTLHGSETSELLRLLHALEEDRGPVDVAATGGLLGTVVRLCPNLRALNVAQSSLPFSAPLAVALCSWATNLRHLTFKTKHCDVDSVALVLDSLPLRSLDVSGLRTCPCRGTTGVSKAASDLGDAIARAPELRRLVLASSRATAVAGGSLFTRMARSSNTVLESLEIRRSPVSGPALGAFLASPAASRLSHLFLGGLKRVYARHLSEALEAAHGAQSSIVSSHAALELELDGRLFSQDLLRMLGHRISRLRVFEPSVRCLELVMDAQQQGRLPRLAHVTLLPREGHEARCRQALQAFEHAGVARAELGDEAWTAVQAEKQQMREAARLEEEARLQSAANAATGDWEADPEGMVWGGGALGCMGALVTEAWSGGGAIDVWRE